MAIRGITAPQRWSSPGGSGHTLGARALVVDAIEASLFALIGDNLLFEFHYLGQEVGVTAIAAGVNDGAPTEHQSDLMLTTFETAHVKDHGGPPF